MASSGASSYACGFGPGWRASHRARCAVSPRWASILPSLRSALAFAPGGAARCRLPTAEFEPYGLGELAARHACASLAYLTQAWRPVSPRVLSHGCMCVLQRWLRQSLPASRLNGIHHVIRRRSLLPAISLRTAAVARCIAVLTCWIGLAIKRISP